MRKTIGIMLLAIALCVALPIAVSAAPEDAITFTDPVAETVIRKELGNPDAPITKADMLRVETFVYDPVAEANAGKEGVTVNNLTDAVNYPRLASIADLAHCENLKTLYVMNQPIDSLEPLRNLALLESIDMWSCPVDDLSPLAGKEHLYRVALVTVPAKDVSPVLLLPSLSFFVLDNYGSNGGGVPDLSPLQNTKNLEVFLMRGNQSPVDLTPLLGHKGMQRVDLRYVEPDMLLSMLDAWPGLIGLSIRNSDLTPEVLEAMQGPALTTVQLDVCKGLSDLTPLTGMKWLKSLSITDCSITDLAPLSAMTWLERFYFQNYPDTFTLEQVREAVPFAAVRFGSQTEYPPLADE